MQDTSQGIYRFRIKTHVQTIIASIQCIFFLLLFLLSLSFGCQLTQSQAPFHVIIQTWAVGVWECYPPHIPHIVSSYHSIHDTSSLIFITCGKSKFIAMIPHNDKEYPNSAHFPPTNTIFIFLSLFYMNKSKTAANVSQYDRKYRK